MSYRACYNESDRRAAKRYRERHYRHPQPFAQTVVNIIVPEDVERREEHAPCFKCGVRADIACRHRPWMIAS